MSTPNHSLGCVAFRSFGAGYITAQAVVIVLMLLSLVGARLDCTAGQMGTFAAAVAAIVIIWIVIRAGRPPTNAWALAMVAAVVAVNAPIALVYAHSNPPEAAAALVWCLFAASPVFSLAGCIAVCSLVVRPSWSQAVAVGFCVIAGASLWYGGFLLFMITGTDHWALTSMSAAPLVALTSVACYLVALQWKRSPGSSNAGIIGPS
jgi:hypothetical protein